MRCPHCGKDGHSGEHCNDPKGIAARGGKVAQIAYGRNHRQGRKRTDERQQKRIDDILAEIRATIRGRGR